LVRGETEYSTETLADNIVGFMQAIGLQRAHVCGLSMGGAVGLWLAAKYPTKVLSLSVHSCWPKTDLFLKTVLESWQTTAKALASVSETHRRWEPRRNSVEPVYFYLVTRPICRKPLVFTGSPLWQLAATKEARAALSRWHLRQNGDIALLTSLPQPACS